MKIVSGLHRYPELDACRGIAIVMMVIFHLVFDLSFFSLFSVDVQEGFWRMFGYATASFFVLIAGVAVSLRLGRFPSDYSFISTFIPVFKRGLYLFGAGLLVTLGTFLVLQGSGYVIFGILHLIAAGTILSPFFFRMKQYVLIPGILILLVGWLVPLPVGSMWLAWAGIHPSGFYSVDYTPLIPWLGVFLIGMAVGVTLYPGGVRSYQVLPWFDDRRLSILAVPGRHSLLIYLIHQPVLVLLLTLIFGKLPGL